MIAPLHPPAARPLRGLVLPDPSVSFFAVVGPRGLVRVAQAAGKAQALRIARADGCRGRLSAVRLTAAEYVAYFNAEAGSWS